MLSTKMRPIHAHGRDVFPLFMKFWGPQKRRGGVLDPLDPPLIVDVCGVLVHGIICRKGLKEH